MRKTCKYLLSYHFAVTQRLDVLIDDYHRNEFNISNVLNESCLLFCSHIIILALIFIDQVFIVFKLTFVKEFFHFRISFKQHQLKLLIKKRCNLFLCFVDVKAF